MITDGLSTLKSKDGLPARVLVTGSTGYIGGRLVPELLALGYRVSVLARNAQRLKDYPWIRDATVVEGDAQNDVDLSNALSGIDVAYYMLHALLEKDNFESIEHDLAEKFGRAAKAAGVRRIVYLGGMITENNELSPHMSSRKQTGEILRASGVPTIELRAGVVIGSGSASFEMLRYLTERLPIMTVPKWVQSKIQPIAIRDVLRYLVGAAAIDENINDHFDIGGPDVFSYEEMMQQYAQAAGFGRRIIIPIPVLTPRLSSGWVGLVTPVPYTLAKRLVASLKNDVVAQDRRIDELVPLPAGGLTSFQQAVRYALAKIKDHRVETRWSSASTPGTASEPLPTDPDWAGGSIYRDIRKMKTPDSVDTVWRRVERIGGVNGYSTATWAWELRGLIDRIFGGVGLRRGRRDPEKLQVGEALDFWRVEELERPQHLRLRAEMKMPGLAWLEWIVIPGEGETTVVQRAIYVPRGIFGHAYWWIVWPMHGLVFPSMLKNVAHGR